MIDCNVTLKLTVVPTHAQVPPTDPPTYTKRPPPVEIELTEHYLETGKNMSVLREVARQLLDLAFEKIREKNRAAFTEVFAKWLQNPRGNVNGLPPGMTQEEFDILANPFLKGGASRGRRKTGR